MKREQKTRGGRRTGDGTQGVEKRKKQKEKRGKVKENEKRKKKS